MVAQPSQHRHSQISPVKKSDDLDRIVQKLNSKYNLGLAPRQQSGVGSVNEAVWYNLRFLLYKDEAKLYSTLREFFELASTSEADWVFKPQADQDTIPRREREHDSFHLRQKAPEQRSLSPQRVEELRLLLRDLSDQAKMDGTLLSRLLLYGVF